MELTLANSVQKALIDETDYPKTVWANWFLATNGYVVANRDNTQVYLHRFLMGEPKERIDHKDRNPLNNQRTNLRLATHSQNLANTGPRNGRVFIKQEEGDFEHASVLIESNYTWASSVRK